MLVNRKVTQNMRNPLLPPDVHIPDAEAHVFSDGKLYLYGSFDESRDYYCSGEYHVASTPDMKHWTVSDTSFETRQAKWVGSMADLAKAQMQGVHSFAELPIHLKRELTEEDQKLSIEAYKQRWYDKIAKQAGNIKLLYAPDAIERNGLYYLYMCFSDGSEGVAVSNRPEGPFRNPVRLAAQGIDPAVFIDDDGQAYYYWGQFSGCGAKLTEDMLSLDESSITTGLVTEQNHFFHEGSSMRKRGDLYYYVFSDISRGRPTCLGYATARTPLGPFTYQGVIIDNSGCDPASWNNHGSIEEFQGQWYVFYHRSSRNSVNMRRVCCEKIYFDEDGRIAEVPMTSQGAGDPFSAGEWVEAYRCCILQGGAYLDLYEGQECIVNLTDGAEAVIRYIRVQDGQTVCVRGDGTARLQLYLDQELCGEGFMNAPIVFSCHPGVYELTIRVSDVHNCHISGVQL